MFMSVNGQNGFLKISHYGWLVDFTPFQLLLVYLMSKSIEETLKGAVTPGYREPWTNSNKRLTPHFSELEPYHQMQFNVILRSHPF